MEMDFWGSSLPPQFGQSAQPEHGSDPNGSEYSERVCSAKAKKHSDRSKHKVGAKYIS